MTPFECVVKGRAASSQGSRKAYGEWRAEVAREARGEIDPVEPPAAGPVAVRILMVYPESEGDLDNRIKGTLDALNTIVYIDDRQVSDLEVSRRWVRPDLILARPNTRIRDAIASGDDFVYICVTDAPPQRVIP